MATHLLSNGIPVEMENRHLLYERHTHYYKSYCEGKRHGKTKHHSEHHHKTKYHHKDSDKAKKPKCPTKKPYKSKKPYKTKKPSKKKDPKKPKKLKPKDPPDVNNPGSPGGGNNPGGNNPNDPYNPSNPYNPNDPYNPYNPGGNNTDGNSPNNPGGLDGPNGNNPGNNTATSSYLQTPTAMPNALPSTQDRPKLSVGGIAIVTVILLGVIALVAFVVYRKRSSLRRGAVRLEDYDDDDSIEPRFLSMSNIRSLRVLSMPPKVQLTRLSSATILFPFRNSTTLNDNLNNNGYMSSLSPPHTRNPNLLSPTSPLSSSRDDYNDYSQRTDSVQSHPSSSSHESYTSLQGSFPVPPQRNDMNDSTPASATFGDIYKLKTV